MMKNMYGISIYGEVDKKKSGWNKHETIKEYVDELYRYNFEVLFVGEIPKISSRVNPQLKYDLRYLRI